MRIPCWGSSGGRRDGGISAADLTGEVFAAVLESLDGFRPELGSARGWLFGIARHELAQLWRRRRVEAGARRRVGMGAVELTDEDSRTNR